MYQIDFYKTQQGYSPIVEYLDGLRALAHVNKDARIQFTQMSRYIELLQENGFDLPIKFLKHLDGDIWELRPGKNRVLLFCYENGVFVLLHHFRKKTQKTPKSEITRAKAEMNDYRLQKEAKR